MDYYNNIPAPSLDKNQKNFSDFDQMQGTQEDMIKMMEKLNIGPNNENLFNPISNNNNLGINQMRGEQMKQWEEDDESAFNLNQALNQLSQNQNNQFGNMNNLSDNLGNIMNNETQNKMKSNNKNQNNQFGNINNISDNLGNIMNNEKQNKMKSNRNQNKKNNLQQNTDNQMNIFNQLNQNLLNPMLLNNMNLNSNLLSNYQGNNLSIPNKSPLLGNMNNFLGLNNNK